MMRVRKRVLHDGQACYELKGDAADGTGAANRYLLYLTNLDRSPNTIRAYATDLRLWIGWLTDLARPWESADLELLGQFVHWLRTSRSGHSDEVVTRLISAQPGRSPKTVNRAVGTIFAFYEFHSEAGAPISRQLVDFRSTHHDYKRSLGRRSSRRRPITLPEPSTRPATLSPAQVGNLVRACEHRRDRLLIGFWWLAGLRVGQTLGLRHDDIDARKAQLRIVPRANPNGARPKVRETQTVPLRPEILELYGEYVREELQSVESDYVFVNLWCEPLGSPMTYSAVDGLVRRLRAHSGENFTPHQLRHTFATDLHREGVSLEVISRLLTHRSISTTSDLYLHLDVEDLRAGLEMAKRARS